MKLAINKPRGEYEQDADPLADQKMRMGQSHEHLQTGRVKASSAGETIAPPLVYKTISSPGQPLDAAAQAFMEPRFGLDFSKVRVHHDAESARSVNALAYTVGNHIVFGAGQYNSSLNEGRRLIAHELAHVAQQRDQPAPGPARAVVTVSDAGDPAEREADALASRVMSNAGPPGVPARTADPSVVYRQQVKSIDPRCGKTQALSAEDLNAEGKLAHVYIQADYAKNPGGDTWPEYGIPDSTPKGYFGRADIADMGRRMIYEIKVYNLETLEKGYRAVAGKVAAANDYCGGGWKLGTKYPSEAHLVTVDPMFGPLYAWQFIAGLIAYQWRVQPPVPVKAKEPAKEKAKEKAKPQPSLAPALESELDALEAKAFGGVLGLPVGGPTTLLGPKKVTVDQVKDVLVGLGLVAVSAAAVYGVIVAAPVALEAVAGLTELVGSAAISMRILQSLKLIPG